MSILSYHQEDFGINFADFEHELGIISTRKGLSSTIEVCPELLKNRFFTGDIADAWVAAYAEQLAFIFRLNYPDWIWSPDRFLNEPYFQDAQSTRAKLFHILKSPPAFTRRNLFVDCVLPSIQLKRGRPTSSLPHKRMMNRKRVARYRSRQ